MFTGIVSEIGEIVSTEPDGAVVRLVVASAYDPEGIDLGASIACSGVCLTVTGVEIGADGRTLTGFDLGPETLAVTTAKDWREGTRLNLERALRVGDELGGHIVLGHVDGVAEITAREDAGEAVTFRFAAPAALAKFIAVKGSVCIDGTSLTVNHVKGNAFDVTLIPHTLAVTAWGERKKGDRVNLEVDQLARYAARLAEAGDGA
ncbi:riboflavin synthase subunit alpha [Terrihabitans soli]|uniref:Riboflavin synthase n=1 Tax=Terrihabitans soli TaxID=708113 RepID=A0A6S6QRQ2_9HYPH|nr:riboflavin synthase [Terrihabitans soli]BCJ90627.1 riboflavin synthase subunit alpha [Terrihabitans soli]